MAIRHILTGALTGMTLAACTSVQEQSGDLPAAADIVPVVNEPVVADPAVEAPYITYVTGRPPLVTDRFLMDSADQQIVGELQIIKMRYEDTFVDIARTYNLGYDELVQANPDIDPWLPGEGTAVLLPTQFILPDVPKEGIVINLASKRLFWFEPPDEDGQRVVTTHPIGIGEEGTATPTGITTITQKVKDPTWFVPASIRAEYAAEGNPLPLQVPPGPENPLGTHALLLGMPSYLLHGTNRPAGVGMRVSHGCVRLFPENIEVLYSRVKVGTSVTIVDQPWLLGWKDDRLFLEAHTPLDDDERDWASLLPGLLKFEMIAAPYLDAGEPDAYRVHRVTGESRGIPLPVLHKDTDIDVYVEDALLVNNVVVYPSSDAEQVAQQAAD